MNVLRDNKESLMAVLEAFVYDPLINWRLMQTETEPPRAEGKTLISFCDDKLTSLDFQIPELILTGRLS
jgi:phosphatidylinositol kinase/protein kinase (PI-3  family)